MESEDASPESEPKTTLPSPGRTFAANAVEEEPIVDESRRWWKFKFRPFDDEDEQDWWFASTGIPLVAATLGPLANVLSIAALVSYWRMWIVDDAGHSIPELSGIPFPDPRWCYWLNVASLIMGFVGNIFLLFNFTNRIRYIIALPMTIILWYLATAVLIAITVSMNVYAPPLRPHQTYTQGFWYAVIAAVLYLICSMILMVNMLGYFLGHYPSHFNLTDSQRTLILQTMMFFIWLAGGGAIFSRIQTSYGGNGNAWSFADGIYFCDVTILTVGFGDLYPTDDVGRGIVFPYSVGGIIMLGLVISSLHRFVAELGTDNLVRTHMEHQRSLTFDRAVTNPTDLQRRIAQLPPGQKPVIKGPFDPVDISELEAITSGRRRSSVASTHSRGPRVKPHRRTGTLNRIRSRAAKQPKILLLREERDRFAAMRAIQRSTHNFKRWWALTLSVISFSILWCIGAIVFWQTEKDAQGMSYFRALYFCYVSLLTIGYGDLSPKTNAGRCFFVVWSLVAVPTMTILVSDMGDTVIGSFKRWTSELADFTVLPKEGIWRSWLDRHPWVLSWVQYYVDKRAAKKRAKEGLPTGPAPEDANENGSILAPSVEQLAVEEDQPLSDVELGRKLAVAIRRAVYDSRLEHPKRYSYEEWVEFTRLIRSTAPGGEKEVEEEEEERGLVEWDWIGEDSPMMSGKSEAEFVLEKLLESLQRFVKRTTKVLSMSGAASGDVNTMDEVDFDEREEESPKAGALNTEDGKREVGKHVLWKGERV